MLEGLRRLNHQQLQIHCLSAQIVLPIVSHYDEREKKCVVVLCSKKDFFCERGFLEIVVMNKEITTVRVKHNEAEVCLLVKELQLACLSLREVLDLADYMFGIHTIFHLILWELRVHLIHYILCGLWRG